MPFENLLSPGRIGTLALRNRILMCPMGDDQATAGGYVTPQQIAYYEARARGGAALLLVGSVGISSPEGLASPEQSAIGDESFLEGWRRLADTVHAHGTKLALQLVHNGKAAVEDILAGRPLMVPSLPGPAGPPDPLLGMLTPEEAGRMGTPQAQTKAPIYHVMTPADIAAMAERYADAVERARDAGIDACELHAGHGYLIDNFLSPTTNHRSDAYGGAIEGRARFLVDVITAIRRRVGRDFPLWCRMNGEEYLVEGQTLPDAIRVAELAEEAGVDALHVSAYADPGRAIGYTEAHATHIPGRFVPLAAAIRARVGIPIITAGRIEPEAAEQILAKGQADFVAMGRKLLADPELPNKLAAGEPESVRPCMYHYRCISQIFERSKVRCAVNSFTGFETERRIEPSTSPRRVLVVGGGPAGMEAARLAALRGDRVVLAEADDRLGGRFALAARTAETNAALLRWFEGEMSRREVEVRLKTRMDADTIAAEGFDAVFVATGARWPRPDVPGANLPHVFGVDELRSWLDTDAAPDAERGETYVVLGGDRAGVALASVARARGAEVTVLEPGGVFCAAVGLVGRWRYVHEALEAGVQLEPDARLTKIEPDAVHWLNLAGEARSTPATRVIVSSGALPETSLFDALKARGVPVEALGDGDSIGLVEGAMARAAALLANPSI